MDPITAPDGFLQLGRGGFPGRESGAARPKPMFPPAAAGGLDLGWRSVCRNHDDIDAAPRQRAATATAAPRLQEEKVVDSGRSLRVIGEGENAALCALPGATKEPLFWKFSHLKKSLAPEAASSSALVSTGVRWIWDAIRSRAARMSASWRGGEKPGMALLRVHRVGFHSWQSSVKFFIRLNSRFHFRIAQPTDHANLIGLTIRNHAAPVITTSHIGIDVGGTFTDFSVSHWPVTGRSCTKVPSTPAEPDRAIIPGLEGPAFRTSRIAAGGITRLAHGTTVGTNALIQRRVGKVGLVTTAGFRDLLEIGRQTRPFVYNIHEDNPKPLVPRQLRLEVRERMRSDGAVHLRLNEEDVRAAGRRLRRLATSTASPSAASSMRPCLARPRTPGRRHHCAGS